MPWTLFYCSLLFWLLEFSYKIVQNFYLFLPFLSPSSLCLLTPFSEVTHQTIPFYIFGWERHCQVLPQVKNIKQQSLESMRTLCLVLLLYLGIGTDIFNHHRYPIYEKQSLIVVIIINNIYWLILIQSNQSKTLTLSHRNVLIAMDYTQLLDAVFVISRITKVKVGLSAEAEADNPYQK